MKRILRGILYCGCFLMLPRAAFAWNEPDSFSGIKFWHPINESLAECPLENRKDVLGPALADTLAATTEKMKQSRASAEKLLALHEEEKKRISEEYERRKELYRKGLIARAELDQTERALDNANSRVEEDKRWIADSDNTIAAQAARKPPAPYKSKQKVYDSTKTREMNQPCWQEHGNDGFFVKNINLSPWALDVTAYTLNNKVSHLLISFHRNAYERVLLTFKERYGTPTGSRTEIWRSQIGATFNNQITNWDGRRLSIMLAQIGTVTVDHGLITYDTAEWQAESARRLKEEIKKAAKGL